MKTSLLRIVLFAVFVIGLQTAFGQGVTTSGMNGRVMGNNNESLPSANIVAIDVPTGSQYATTSDVKGYYYLPNMNVGGPYTVSLSYVGYETFVKENIYLSLGQTLQLNVTLQETAYELGETEIVALKNDLFDGNRTGAETDIGLEKIEALPSISGDLNDFTRLTPQATVVGSGISMAGMNNRYNAVYIDGTINNDVFGLAANGMNGGQTGIAAISFEAIDQFHVGIAPFDIRQSGFAGAGINAVTKSGTNSVNGSIYFKNRNENWAGKTPGDVDKSERTKLAEFSSKTYGFTIGGPIIKNKLFYFINAELQNDQTPQPFSFGDYTGNSTQSELDDLRSFLVSNYEYDPGNFIDNARELNGKKILARLDYNINKNHKLMARYSYVYGESVGPNRSDYQNINYYNSGVFFPSTTHTAAIELKSVFGSKYSNSLKFGYTNVLDDRDPMGDPFPAVVIEDGEGTIHFGSEIYSTGNNLHQKIFTITDNFQIYKGQHTITVGTHNEFYSIYNLFMRRAFGYYEYDDIASFMAGGNSSMYRIGYSLVDDVRGDGSKAAADFNAMQLGFYVQDEYQWNENLKVTGGLRVDIPMFSDDPPLIPGFNDTTVTKLEKYYDLGGAQSGSMPKSQILFSPRVGFNWDVHGDKKTQLRGGIGIFTSRVPFVWPAGSYTNNGMIIGDYRSYGDQPFNPDWETQYKPSDVVVPGSGSQVDLYTEDFKFPQMLKANLAVDHKFGQGFVGTVEFIYSKTINNVLWQDVNMKPSWGNASGTPDDRPLYKTYQNGIESNYGQIMLGGNTNEGYTYNITAQIKKNFNCGFNASVAYTYGKAESIFDGTSSQNSSQWNYLVSNPIPRNNAPLGISDFDMGHRIVSFLSYAKGGTGISLFYNGQTGRPFSYIYNDYSGSFTNEAYRGPQLIYIPNAQSDIIFVGTPDEQQAQWNELNAFIEQDDYLSENRGSYAERNAARLPWTNIFDLKFSQNLVVFEKSSQILQLTIDLFNIGNMINKDWGRIYYASDNNIGIIKFEGMEADANSDYTVPTFSFTRPKNDEPWQLDDSGLNSSRWQAQIGVRYIFGKK